MRPGPFLKWFFLPSGRCFFLGLRPGLSRPSGVLPPAGNFLLAQKVPQKRLPPVALRGFSLHSQPSWSFPHLPPSARVAGHCENSERVSSAICGHLGKYASLATLLELSSLVSISEGRGALCKIWSVSALLSAFNLVSSTRGFQMAHMPTLPYLMSIHGLTKSNVKLTLQQHYIAAC